MVPAPAAEGDPGGARRAGPGARPRSTSCASSSTRAELPEDVAHARPTASSSRLEKLPQAAAEHGVIRTYLEWIAELPWSASAPTTTSTSRTRARCSTPTTTTSRRSRTASSSSSPCASSSRTRAARSSASPGRPASARPRSASRSPARSGASSSASASAACATSRRSAATAAPTSARCPGTIMRALRDAGANNPVFMIDEIDKMGADYRGDPASAMLEVLDPEQNSDVPRPLPRRPVRPLARDVHLHGERPRPHPGAAARPHGGHRASPATPRRRSSQIAKRYLVPRQIERNGLKRSQIAFTDAGLKAIIADYTREAGVRALEREIGSVVPQGRAAGRGGHARAQGHGHRAARPRAARAPALHDRRAPPHRRARRRHRARLDAGRRRRAVRRGDRDARARAG